MERMTDGQASYILDLCNQISGRRDDYLSQARDIHGFSSFKLQRGVGKAEASATIRALQQKLDEKK